MAFIQQESIGRSGEHSRLRDKLLLLNARTRLSQQGVASFVGVSTAALRNWEAGQSKPTAQNLRRLIELYVAYRAFAEGEEQTEAADLWEAAQARGLKVPFDQRWFQELLANQQSSQSETERERQPELQYEPGQEPDTEARDDRSSMGNESGLQSQPPETLPSSSTPKLSRRTVVVGLGCLVLGVTAGSSLTWVALRSQTPLPPQAKWTQAGNMLLARGFFRATLLPNGQLLIEGGVLQNKTTTAQSELFDPKRDSWLPTGVNLHYARAKHTSTLLPNGTVLVTGGFDAGTLSSAELYDPTTNTWTLLKDQMKYARARHTATILKTGEVLIAGGAPDNLADLYDYKTDTWSLTRKMVSLRYDHVAIRLVGGTVLVAGGRTKNVNKNINKDNYSITNSAELFDPKKNTWTQLPNMLSERAEFTAALLPDGRVMVIGGRLKNGDVTPTTEIFDPNDPNTSSWQQGPSMNYARLTPLGQEALQFGDGSIMVIGGDTKGTSERYIPTTGKWVSVFSLHSPHYLGATASLGNGQALIAGGFDVLSSDDKSKITASTEIYTPGSE
jgi:N-acetylneuraminic acid mutarotase/transcriptional regulator with XRE-family HTH domain